MRYFFKALYNPAFLVNLLLNTSITHAHFYRFVHNPVNLLNHQSNSFFFIPYTLPNFFGLVCLMRNNI